MRDEDEIREQEERATDAVFKSAGGTAYERGVRDALRWVLEDEDEAPMGGDDAQE